MNQEQNNLNENNFNMQGNNGIPNSQPLNNQNFNNTFNQNVGQSASVNQSESNYQQPLNQMNMQQTTPSFQQPVIQNNQTQSVNSFEGVNTNNQNFNSKPPKKMNLVLIIGIISIVIVVVIIIIVGFVIFSSKKGSSAGIENINNNSIKKDEIKQLLVSSREVVALTNDGDLYYIGDDVEDENVLKKMASNVEKIYNSGFSDISILSPDMWAVYYMDKNNDLYYFGSSYNTGTSYKPKKDYSNVKELNVYMNFCGFAVNSNDELYVKNNNFSNEYCGLDNEIEYDEFTKVTDNVKKAFVGGYIGGYINNNNELYVSTSNSEFKKILDNANSVSSTGFVTMLILTNDNKLYVYGDSAWGGQTYDERNNFQLELLRDDVDKLGENYFKTINGEYNVFGSSRDFEGGQLIHESNSSSEELYYKKLNIVDIKDFIYSYHEKVVYISTDNKITLLDQDGEKRITNNINSIKEIFEFVKK